MKRLTVMLHCVLVMAMGVIVLAGCSSSRQLTFANRVWHISDYYGQIIDEDTTYRMTFGDVLIPVDMAIVSSADSLAKYPGMDRFIADILHTARLDSAEILFYAPHMSTMFVRPKGGCEMSRPSSISSDLSDERPFTMWIYEDDVEDWKRQPREMYTYTYFDRRKRRVLVVDFYDYGDMPVAQIFVFQSADRITDKMQVPKALNHAYYKHDLRRYEQEVEFWSSVINGHRRLAFANYKIGQEQKSRRK